jgi:hypothetical protein
VRPDKGEPFAAAVIIHAPVDILFCGLDGGEMAREIAKIEYAVAAVAFLLDSESTITHFVSSVSNRPAGIAEAGGRRLDRQIDDGVGGLRVTPDAQPQMAVG